jgi:hypothetical protein
LSALSWVDGPVDADRSDGEDLGPAATRDQPRQADQPDPIGIVVSHAGDLSTQDRVLVAQHKQFSVLRRITTTGQHQHISSPRTSRYSSDNTIRRWSQQSDQYQQGSWQSPPSRVSEPAGAMAMTLDYLRNAVAHLRAGELAAGRAALTAYVTLARLAAAPRLAGTGLEPLTRNSVEACHLIAAMSGCSH